LEEKNRPEIQTLYLSVGSCASAPMTAPMAAVSAKAPASEVQSD
jgi:hypothetical protein